MNPFDLSGPEFLCFYAVFSAALITIAFVVRASREGGPAPKIALEPYLIAHLRGGESEAVRVAVVALVDRGLLVVSGSSIQTAPHAEPSATQDRLEQAILTACLQPRSGIGVLDSPIVSTACNPLSVKLEQHGLLPGSDAKAARAKAFALTAALLIGVAAIKIGVALSRRHYNVIFLIFMCIVATVAGAAALFPRQTSRGKAMIKDLCVLFAMLRVRSHEIQPGSGGLELVMLAAVFGIAALQNPAFSYLGALFPKATKEGGSSCGSGCGSSCGSSCGGGCGGGCGGCGG